MPVGWILCFAGVLSAPAGIPAGETVFFDVPTNWVLTPPPAPSLQLAEVPGYPDAPDRLTLIARLHRPDAEIHGPGPYPTILVLHGSGGLWSNDAITNGMASQFEEWASVLSSNGYLSLYVDSFNPRGISTNFANRLPHHDPALDDALCSPNYERPKDVVAALSFLAAHNEVDRDRIGILAFSHGSQVALNAILDPSVDLTPYTVRYINESNATINLEVPSPVRIPDALPFPVVCALYYPGCSHYGYHGQASSISAGRYMPDRRTHVLLFHGTRDSLLGVTDPDATPLTGSLYPIKLVESARLQAEAEAVPNPFIHHLVYDQVNHGFDGVTLADEGDWNSPSESADQKAKRLTRDETLKAFALWLKPVDLAAAIQPLSFEGVRVQWHSEKDLLYTMEQQDNYQGPWIDISATLTGPVQQAEAPFGAAQSTAIRLSITPMPPPVNAPENTGFFLSYDAFSY
ncbi:MAG: hypothetical protein KDL31_11490 [Kiritimatiellae bacterium]|nr:hypothetical protein [Kiritimatiellia bacterium]